MIVYLLRHGIAANAAPGGLDAARELTAEGKARLERAADGWRRVVERIDRVLVSPLVRARQTADIFTAAVCRAAPMDIEPALEPGARALATLEILQGHCAANTPGIACIGHEPHLGSLLGLLLTGNDRVPIPFKKGMLVAVEIESSATMTGRLIAALSQRLAGTG